MLPAVLDATAVRLLFVTLATWLQQHDADAITYLLEENRALRAQIGRHPLRLNDDQRRRLAVLAPPAGTCSPTQPRKPRHPRHASPLASPVGGPEVDLSAALTRTGPRAPGDPAARGAHGQRESDIGLHTDARRPQSRRAPRGSLDDCSNIESARSGHGTRAESMPFLVEIG